MVMSKTLSEHPKSILAFSHGHVQSTVRASYLGSRWYQILCDAVRAHAHFLDCNCILLSPRMGSLLSAVAECCTRCDDNGTLAATFGFCLDDVTFIKHKCKANAVSEGRHPVVLVATGTYAPPHRGHFEMLNRAKAALVDECVGGAIMVPSSCLLV